MKCPKCKKDTLKFIPWLGLLYQCYNCGYRGPVGKIEKRKKS